MASIEIEIDGKKIPIVGSHFDANELLSLVKKSPKKYDIYMVYKYGLTSKMTETEFVNINYEENRKFKTKLKSEFGGVGEDKNFDHHVDQFLYWIAKRKYSWVYLGFLVFLGWMANDSFHAILMLVSEFYHGVR